MPSTLLDLIEFHEDEHPTTSKKGYRRIYTKYSLEQEMDATPAIATEALLAAEKFTGTILDPMAGTGGITKVLEAHGYNVIGRDLVNRDEGNNDIEAGKDFLDTKETFGNIISAPPMKIAAPLAYHAIKHVHRKVAFLTRATFLENRARRDWLFDNPNLPTCFEKLYVFTDRLPVGEANMIMYAWFIWNKKFHGTPTIYWL